jgi:hypothetical protein
MGISSSLGSSALLPAGLGFRNAIINGGFDVWQRGTTVSPASGYGYTTDRWQAYSYAASATTVTRTAFTAGTILGVHSPQFHARINSTSTAMYFEQRIEGVNTFAGQTVTISFYAKHQTATSVPLYIEQNFGSGGSATVSVTGKTFSISTSWDRYTYTFVMPSITGKTIGTSSFLSVYLFSGAVNNYLDLWGFQVEANYQPTPFEQRPIGVELALCHRYFQQYNSSNTATSPPQFPHHIDLSSRGEVALVYNEKRTNPTITVGGTIGNHQFQVLTTGTTYNASAYGGTFVGTGTTAAIMFFTNTGIPANSIAVYIISGDATINISAEL